jgi:phage FluMu protein Com
VAAIGRCRHCGAVKAFGEAVLYVDAPGIVVRCSACDGILLRMVETPDSYWLDVSGLSYLRIERQG